MIIDTRVSHWCSWGNTLMSACPTHSNTFYYIIDGPCVRTRRRQDHPGKSCKPKSSVEPDIIVIGSLLEYQNKYRARMGYHIGLLFCRKFTGCCDVQWIRLGLASTTIFTSRQEDKATQLSASSPSATTAWHHMRSTFPRTQNSKCGPITVGFSRPHSDMIRTMSRREWLDRYQSDVFQRDDWNEQVGIQKHNQMRI